MDKRIIDFIHTQTVLTLATSIENIPYCASCFYSLIEGSYSLAFKSDKTTKHIQDALLNNEVAGTIIPDKSEIGKIKGIQFQGKLIEPEGRLLANAKKSYYKKYPFAIAVKGELWVIELSFIKMTDNQLGFGKKLLWEK